MVIVGNAIPIRSLKGEEIAGLLITVVSATTWFPLLP